MAAQGESQRDYNAAITALNTLQSNFSIVDAIRKSGRGMNKHAIPEMIEWCRRVGYEPSDFDALKVIHIAGTKGKGSTSAFISSILCQYIQEDASNQVNGDPPLRKIGLYTSPHLRSVRERIQINNQPISEASFAKYFFEVWDRLEAAEARLGLPDFIQLPDTPDAPVPLTKPVYFRYLTLMAFHAYLTEGVDTVVLECGIGGEYDSTNVIERPSVTAVTTLGIDHTAMLGETVDEIAWHKAGIFKKTSNTGAAYTVASQPPQALKVLQERAAEKNVDLFLIPRHPDIDSGNVQLGLDADFQKTNASLAVSVAAAHLRSLGVPKVPDPLSNELNDSFRKGLEQVQWSGRCEVRREGNLLWHLDGGHTIESIKLASEWFGSSMLKTSRSSKKIQKDDDGESSPAIRLPQKRILLFNQQTRHASSLAETLYTTLREAIPIPGSQGDNGGGNDGAPATAAAAVASASHSPLFSHAIFSTNVTYASSTTAPAAASPAASSKIESSSSKNETSGENKKGSTDDDNKGRGRYKADLISINASASDVSQLTVQKALAKTWLALDEGCDVRVDTSIEDAIRYIRQLAAQHRNGVENEEGDEVVVLVTGSLHLVGGVLEVLETTSSMSSSSSSS